MSSTRNSFVSEEHEIESILIPVEEESSSYEQSLSPIETLSSYKNEKQILYEQNLYSPGSGHLCNKYIAMSESIILNHVYYNYPAVQDPGIEDALLATDIKTTNPDDGQKIYLQLCSELNQCPVRIFCRSLMNAEINLKYYGVNPKGVGPMATALRSNRYVTRLDLSYNLLSDDSCFHLGEMLKTNTTLKELILEGCHIGASGLLCLGKHIGSQNQTIITLNLAKNKINDTGGVYFARILFNGASLRHVNLSDNKIGKQTAIALAENLEWQNPFTNLDLSSNHFINMPSTALLLDKLAYSNLLQELNLSFNSLEGTKVANAILKILNIPSLKILDLSHNRFQNEAINVLTPGLIHAQKLITLNLSFNPLTPLDAYQILQKMLRPSVKLQNLIMQGIAVKKSFLVLLSRVSKMKYRKNFDVTFGDVLQNWLIEDPDPRPLLLKRAEYKCRINKKHQTDIALYFLRLNKEYAKAISIKSLLQRFGQDKIPLDVQFINELSSAFPGPRTPKSATVDLAAICEFIARIWPLKHSPPSPEPEPLPFLPLIPMSKKKSKKKMNKKK